MINFLRAYFANKDAGTMIEYGLIAAGVSIVIAIVAFNFGEDLEFIFEAVETDFDQAMDRREL